MILIIIKKKHTLRECVFLVHYTFGDDNDMNNNTPNSTNSPMSEYLLKLQLIITNSEFKNRTEAMQYETDPIATAGDTYVHAMEKTDAFTTYTYDSREVYSVLRAYGFSDERAMFLINNQTMIPIACKNKLMENAREAYIAKYKEGNKYYLMLTGKPFPGDDRTPPDLIVTIPDEFYDIYKSDQSISRNQPVHELPSRYQELLMNSKYYQELIDKYPTARYLRYIGSNSIPIVTSRKAKDGDIIRINTSKLSTYHPVFGNVTVSPDIVHKFINTYRETRDYVYNTLRGDFNSIYANYDSFIRFLTIYLAMGNTMNEFAKSASGYIHMNNITANNLFTLYGLPSAITQGDSMIEFLKKFRLILQDKGTNIVYRVKDLIGYEDTDIYTLIMVKQQKFENGVPLYTYDDDGVAHPIQEIVFRRLGTTEDNTSYFKFKNSRVTYTVDEITSGDPRWWNSEEVENMIQDMNYTLSNSKYIQLSTHMSMTDIWWQCVIMLRGLLDNDTETKNTLININTNINGSTQISVFEAVLSLVIMMNYHLKDFRGMHANGNMYIPNAEYNGRSACVDMLFNGLNLAKRYTPLTYYDEGDVVGESLFQLYTVNEDYVSSDQGIQYDINRGKLSPYESKWDEGSPKELIPGSPFKIASFNFGIRDNNFAFYESLKSKEYLEPNTFIPMLDTVLNRDNINLGEALMNDVKSIYKYLENKLVDAKTIHEFRQVTDTYNALFLVDPVRGWDTGNPMDTDALLMDEYKITEYELNTLKSFFVVDIGNPELTITYNDEEYPIYIYQIMNNPVYDLPINGKYPFRDTAFVTLFSNEIMKYRSAKLESSDISKSIKNNYQNIIRSKVEYDSSNTEYGPKTFDALLRSTNIDLYRFIHNMVIGNDTDALTFMRNIIKALEEYTNSPLNGLNFAAIGIDNYFSILKEVITYFKSYMVEFTKNEFVYMFDGLFDNGGNSNMLKLYDEIVDLNMTVIPTDSFNLFDNSWADVTVPMKDSGLMRMHDEVLFRSETTYGRLKSTGYEILFDDNEHLSHEPFDGITDDSMIIGDIIHDSDSAYKIIINIDNVKK